MHMSLNKIDVKRVDINEASKKQIKHLI